MTTWIKWWKDKTMLSVILISIFTVIVGFMLTYFIDWGWILTIIIAGVSGLSIKRIITNRLNKEVEKLKNSNN